MKIPADELHRHALSIGDSRGQLFTWGDRVVRSIAPEQAAFYSRLFSDGTVQQLVDAGLLVKTEPTDLRIGDASLVVEHARLPFVSYCHEWCAAMLKDAALHLLRLEQRLASRGLTLQDAHPWNIVWDGVRPYYVDFCSITEGNDFVEDEFRRFFINPLRLMASGHGRVARWLLHDCDHGVRDAETARLAAVDSPEPVGQIAKRMARAAARKTMPGPVRSTLRRVKNKLRAPAPPPAPAETLPQRIERLRAEVEAIPVVMPTTLWSDYYDVYPSFEPDSSWTPKHYNMRAVLEKTKPRTLLDIGSNRGWFCQLAVRAGVTAVATDIDEPSITKLYFDAKTGALPIQPLIMDLRCPAPPMGIANSWCVPATERFQADIVTALALVHHLVFTHRLGFRHITGGLAAFASKWLLVEFIAKEDQYVANWWTPQHEWYRLDGFIAELQRDFEIVERYASNLPHRTLLLCRRRREPQLS